MRIGEEVEVSRRLLTFDFARLSFVIAACSAEKVGGLYLIVVVLNNS